MGLYSRFKKSFKKAVIFLLILGGIAVLVITFTTFGGKNLFGKKAVEIIIDSDSGNEIDDLYAITRALSCSELEVKGLISSHWSFHKEAGDSSLFMSQTLNERLLELMGKTSLPHPSGANDKLWYFGNPVPNLSPASSFIIQKAKEAEQGKKLNIVCLGALTNVASAIIADPAIAPNIRLYCMGFNYDAKSKTWNKNEFNVKNDLDAADYLLNKEDLEMHIMTASASKSLRFSKEETRKLMNQSDSIGKFLTQKWDDRFPEFSEWIMWDVALIEAIINPDLVKTEQVLAPPENKQRSVRVYTAINNELMKASYWSGIMKSQRQSGKDD
jgi:inosine-uridine nucleoside N-ribohydrolase